VRAARYPVRVFRALGGQKSHADTDSDTDPDADTDGMTGEGGGPAHPAAPLCAGKVPAEAKHLSFV